MKKRMSKIILWKRFQGLGYCKDLLIAGIYERLSRVAKAFLFFQENTSLQKAGVYAAMPH